MLMSVTGMHYALGSYETFQPSFRDEKRTKILGTGSGAKFGKKSKHGETKILTYWPSIARVTLNAVSLQLHGMLMIWKIQQAMQDDAIQNARIHPAVHPGNRYEVFIWQNFQSAYRDQGWKTETSETEPARPALI